jgi:hypothetical protein
MNQPHQDLSARPWGWRTLFALLALCCGLLTLPRHQAHAAAAGQTPASPTLDDLRNAEYRSLNTESGRVQLSAGAFEDQSSGLSVNLTNFYAIGDITGDGVDDAVVLLATTIGAEGPFYSLAGLVTNEGEFRPAGVVLLGEGVRIDELSIANNQILVAYARLRPADPECCPSQEVTGVYALRRGLLVPQQTKAFGLLFPYQEGQLYGYVNVVGDVVIEPQFVQAGNFAEGLAAVSYDGRSTGYINQLGELIIEPVYSYGGPFRHGMALVGLRGVDADKPFVTAFIDRTGSFVFGDTRFVSAEPFSEGVAAVSLDGVRYGYIDLLGQLVIEPQFAHAESFREGLAPVQFGDQYGYIDRTGSFVIPPQFEAAEPFADGRAQIALGGKTGYVNHRGDIVIEPVYDYGSNFQNGRALVALDGLLSYIDAAGNVEIELEEMTRGSDFAEGLAAVAIGDQYGFVDLQGNFVIPPQFSYAGSFQDGLAPFETPASWGVINNIGEVVLEIPKFERPAGVATQLFDYVPALPDERRSGACTGGSNVLTIANAWRCTVDNEVYDPCLLGEDGATVVCGSAPVVNATGFQLELTRPLPEVEVAAMAKMASPPWQLRLDDGTSCTLLRGMALELNGQAVTHVCSDSQVLLGEIDRSGEPWTVEKATVANDEQGNYEVESSQSVGVLSAWQPAAPDQ